MYTFREKVIVVIDKIKSNKKLSLLAIILLVAAVPLTVFIAQQAQDVRQRANTSQASITVTPQNTYAGDIVTIHWTIEQPTNAPTIITPTTIPTITPTNTPAPTNTPIPTPTINPCPMYQKSTSMTPNGLVVSLTATGGNQIKQVFVNSYVNATINATSPMFPPPGSNTVAFTIMQVASGQASQVNVTVTDNCGQKSDFFGAGANAGWPSPPLADPTPTYGPWRPGWVDPNAPPQEVHKNGYNIFSPLIKKAYAQTTILDGATLQLFRKEDGVAPYASGEKIYLDCQQQIVDEMLYIPPLFSTNSGTCSYKIPEDTKGGTYFFRMFSADETTVMGESALISIKSSNNCTGNNVVQPNPAKQGELITFSHADGTVVDLQTTMLGNGVKADTCKQDGKNITCTARGIFLNNRTSSKHSWSTAQTASQAAVLCEYTVISTQSTINTTIMLETSLIGIGAPTGNTIPKHPDREAIISFFDINNVLVISHYGNLVFNAKSGTFEGFAKQWTSCKSGTNCTTAIGADPNNTGGQTCMSDADCQRTTAPPAMKCFRHENYPGTCKPVDTVCAQAEVKACTFEEVICAQAPCEPKEVCATFPNHCVVPLEWVKEGDPKPTPSTSLPAGNYTVKIQTPQFLRKQIPGIIIIKPGEPIQLPAVTLITGDINTDNKINILDYNLLASCYGEKRTTEACKITPQFSLGSIPLAPIAPLADLNDDGVVDGVDYNLFIRSLANKDGD